MKAIEILQKGEQIIHDVNHWTRGWYAKDKNDDDVDAYSIDAVSFCSIGCLQKARSILSYSDDLCPEYTIAKDALKTVMGMDIVDYNDNHYHSEVLEKFDEAIQLLEAEELRLSKIK